MLAKGRRPVPPRPVTTGGFMPYGFFRPHPMLQAVRRTGQAKTAGVARRVSCHPGV